MEVSFYLTRAEEGKQTALYAHIRYPSHKFKYYLSERIDPQFWNSKDQQAKKTNRFPGYMEFNRRLGKIRDKIKDIYTAYRNDHGGNLPTPAMIKDLIDKELKGQVENGYKTFISFFEDLYNGSVTGSRVQPKTGKPFARTTIKNYKTAIDHLKAFELFRKRKIEFEDINIEFHADFTEFLIKKYKLAPNTIGTDMKSVKMVMNEATERGLSKNYQYKSRKFSIAKETINSIYLTQNELAEMLQVDFTANSRLERVRDMFIVGCYTGLRFSDLSLLKPANVQDGFIKITQLKTDHEIVIPVHPVVRDILEKYKGRLPKPISNQKTNAFLKEIGQQCPLLDATVAQSFTKAGVRVLQNFKKWELVGSHTARRSFCTNEFLAGTPAELIMQISGHKSAAAFRLYLRLTPTEGAQKMKDLWATRNQLKAI